MPNNNERENNDREKAKPRKVKNTNKKRTKVNKNTKNKKPEARKSSKGKKEKFSGRHPKFMLGLKIMIVLFLLLCVIGAGIVAGMFFGLFGDEFEITKEELKIGAANSVIVDTNGGNIANLSGDEKRKIITLEEMAEYLPKAYVAIEDERFYKHSGVDLKRTAGAIVHKIFGKAMNPQEWKEFLEK